MRIVIASIRKKTSEYWLHVQKAFTEDNSTALINFYFAMHFVRCICNCAIILAVSETALNRRCFISTFFSQSFSAHADIATTTSVTELRGAFLISVSILALTTSAAIPIGILVISTFDSTNNLSAEAISAVSGSICWIVIVELALFLGVFGSALVILISVVLS